MVQAPPPRRWCAGLTWARRAPTASRADNADILASAREWSAHPPRVRKSLAPGWRVRRHHRAPHSRLLYTLWVEHQLLQRRRAHLWLLVRRGLRSGSPPGGSMPWPASGFSMGSWESSESYWVPSGEARQREPPRPGPGYRSCCSTRCAVCDQRCEYPEQLHALAPREHCPPLQPHRAIAKLVSRTRPRVSGSGVRLRTAGLPNQSVRPAA